MFGVLLQKAAGLMDTCQTYSESGLLPIPLASAWGGALCRELVVNLRLMVRQPWYEPGWRKLLLPPNASTTLSEACSTAGTRTPRGAASGAGWGDPLSLPPGARLPPLVRSGPQRGRLPLSAP